MNNSTRAVSVALRYIVEGEAHGFHQRPSCAGRPRWWDLGIRRKSKLNFNYLIDSTARTLYAEDGCYASDNFQEIHTSFSVLAVCAALNSTIFQLMVNMAGRTNFGGGLLKIQTYEVADLLCVSPASFTFDDTVLLQSDAWDVLSPSPARRTLDTMLFDALGLTQAERDAVYEEVIRLVENRLSRANSV